MQCHCLQGYVGRMCDEKQKPCADNPCESRGECFEKNGKFHCRCHAWWEGPRCERRMMRIPYKPLSERMLQEPFWLGLITVFVVLAFIGLVWCAKRHFPEKIEKLLTEEADRNRRESCVMRAFLFAITQRKNDGASCSFQPEARCIICITTTIHRCASNCSSQ